MKLTKAVLPMNYDTYVFDLYGTLTDIHTEEGLPLVWEKLALFYGFYDAEYTPEELKEAYGNLVHEKQKTLKEELEQENFLKNQRAADAHEASPEIEITEVFSELFRRKGVEADQQLAVYTGQFFRILSTEYVRNYPNTREMLQHLKSHGKRVYLLSNAQRIFTEFEMHTTKIAEYFDGILISSDYRTRKPDPAFFRVLKEKYGVDPAKSLFIGNDSVNDIRGAINAGYHTFYVRSNISPENDSAPEADYQVDVFTEWALQQD